MALENSFVHSFSLDFKSHDGEDAAKILANMPNFIILNQNPLPKFQGTGLNFIESVRTPVRPSSSQRKRPNKPVKFFSASVLPSDSSLGPSVPVLKGSGKSKVRNSYESS
jgi:hypothetical protein